MVLVLGPAGRADAAAPADVPPAPSASTALPRAVIDEFDWASVSTNVQAIFGTHVDIGKGIRARLITRVHEAGRLRLIEGAMVGSSGPSGDIIAADVYLRGDIVAFGRDDRTTRIALGQVGLVGPLAGVRVGRKQHKAVVSIAYRLVDAHTGEVLAAGKASGESTRESTSIGGLLGRRRGIAGGAADMTSVDFAETLIGEAVVAATNRLAALLNEMAPGLRRP
jgi:curli biogenesis system outer membrane secretion channel CsgG